MPEMTFAVRWPDGQQTSHYSPSLVMHDYLRVGERYTLSDFVGRTSEALAIASERVRARYGFACTSAMHSEETIATAASAYAAGEVVVVAMQPGLEGAAS
ncbi:MULTISPECIES: MSMEG_0570 family nitrogen starvation response protein [unclassified Microbacterium]|uniref:MSMEG_0570 family nitrogen starvation response protein n=1 Tax=unclassified Microbacterium TaxID=2609290 RepID=UPI000D57A583|nr:MSMEG_0570 family nitrogen starvation response protein [Microbacterium sp. Gd 4-13]PVW03825.1 MSMEG_0570 family nitrogen starvation response protein [Microbacterium sp. Gd 4-13]